MKVKLNDFNLEGLLNTGRCFESVLGGTLGDEIPTAAEALKRVLSGEDVIVDYDILDKKYPLEDYIVFCRLKENEIEDYYDEDQLKKLGLKRIKAEAKRRKWSLDSYLKMVIDQEGMEVAIHISKEGERLVLNFGYVGGDDAKSSAGFFGSVTGMPELEEGFKALIKSFSQRRTSKLQRK